MTTLDAAFAVLQAAGAPLHSDEIARRIVRQWPGILRGKTPGTSVASRIYMDIKKKGAASRFEKTAPGTIGLRGTSSAAPDTSNLPDVSPPDPAPLPGKPGSFKEAAFRILNTSPDRKLMHYRDITRRALTQRLITTKGKTPEYTMEARLTEDIRRCERRGERSRFIKSGQGMFGLSCWEKHEPGREPKAHRHRRRGVSPPVPAPEPGKPGSFKEAAFQILNTSPERKPLHYREITRRALAQGLISSRGKTPESTMGAILIEDIRRCERRAERSRFSKSGRGVFGLSRWEKHGMAREIEDHNGKVREELLGLLREVPPERFERLIAELLVKIGFEDVTTTTVSRDGGIDVRGVLVEGDVIRTSMAVQAKRWANNVPAPVVQQVRGSLGVHERGLIITTSAFSSGAQREAGRPDATPVGLMDGERLVGLLIEHELGVNRRSQYLWELDTDFLLRGEEGEEEEGDSGD